MVANSTDFPLKLTHSFRILWHQKTTTTSSSWIWPDDDDEDSFPPPKLTHTFIPDDEEKSDLDIFQTKYILPFVIPNLLLTVFNLYNDWKRISKNLIGKDFLKYVLMSK